MALTAQRSIIGITDIGTYTGDFGGPYTKTSWGLTQEAGATLRQSTTAVTQKSGQSVFIQHSQVTDVAAQLEFGLINAVLSSLQKMMGLPSGALTGDLSAGTPTMEVLVVKGTEIATVEYSLYLTQPGPEGPRNWYYPHLKVSALPDMVMSKSGHQEPRTTFDLMPDASDRLYWIEDTP